MPRILKQGQDATIMQIQPLDNKHLQDLGEFSTIVYDNYTSNNVIFRAKNNITPEQRSLLNRIFYDEQSLEQIQSYLDSDSNTLITHGEIENEHGRFLVLAYPSSAVDAIGISERIFIDRAYDRSDADKLDVSLVSSAALAAYHIGEYIYENDLVDKKISVAARVPVESVSTKEVNSDIQNEFAKKITDLLTQVGVSLQVSVSLVSMRFNTLAKMTDKKNWAQLKNAILADGTDLDGTNLFVGGRPNTQIRSKNMALYIKLRGISKATDEQELADALKMISDPLFFNNHSRHKALRPCYDRLRFIGASQKLSSMIDPDSGYLYLFSSENQTRADFEQTRRTISGLDLNYRYSDGGKIVTSKCTVGDVENAFVSSPIHAVFIADGSGKMFDCYSLLKSRGDAFEFFSIDDARQKQMGLKIIRLDTKPKSRDSKITEVDIKPIIPSIRQEPNLEPVRPIDIKPLSEDEHIDHLKQKNAVIYLYTDESGSMGLYAEIINKAFSDISTKINKSPTVDSDHRTMHGRRYDPDDYNASVNSFIENVKKNYDPEKEYHCILVGDGGDQHWDHSRYISDAHKYNIKFHYIEVGSSFLNFFGPFSISKDLARYSGGNILEWGGKSVRYFRDNEDELRLELLKLINNTREDTDRAEYAEDLLDMGFWKKALELDETLRPKAAEVYFDQLKEQIDSSRVILASDIEELVKVVQMNPRLAESVADYLYDKDQLYKAVEVYPGLGEKVADRLFDLGKEGFRRNSGRSKQYFDKSIEYDAQKLKDVAYFYIQNSVLFDPIIQKAADKYPDFREDAADALFENAKRYLEKNIRSAEAYSRFKQASVYNPELDSKIAELYTELGDEQRALEFSVSLD